MNRNRIVMLAAVWAVALTVAAMAHRPEGAALAAQDASISGRIIYTDGRPVTRYPVDYRPAADSRSVNTVRTDSDGRFVISGLGDGVYFVGFFQPDRLPADRNPRVEALPDVSPELAQIGAPKGQRVVIANGQSVDGVDFVLIDVGAELPSTEGVAVGPGDLGLPEAGGSPSTASGGISAVAIVPFLALGIIALALGSWNLIRRRGSASNGFPPDWP